MAAKIKPKKPASIPTCAKCSKSSAGLMGLQAFTKTQMGSFILRRRPCLLWMLLIRAFKFLNSLFDRCFLPCTLLCWIMHCMSAVIVDHRKWHFVQVKREQDRCQRSILVNWARNTKWGPYQWYDRKLYISVICLEIQP